MCGEGQEWGKMCLLELEVLEDLGPEQAAQVRRPRELVPWQELLRHGCTAHEVPPLEHCHLLARLRSHHTHMIGFNLGCPAEGGGGSDVTLARYAAVTRPLCPPPTTMASHLRPDTAVVSAAAAVAYNRRPCAWRPAAVSTPC
jgi:hypothetical protein